MGLAAHSSSHPLALEHLARELALPNRPRLPVGFRIAVSSRLSAEVPSLDSPLEAPALRDALHVHPLPWTEMQHAQLVSNRQQRFFTNLKLRQISLGPDPSFGEVPHQGLWDIFEVFLSSSHLDPVEAMLRGSLDLSDLASVDLEHSAGHHDPPRVKYVSHSHFVSNETRSARLPVLRDGPLKLPELRVHLLLLIARLSSLFLIERTILGCEWVKRGSDSSGARGDGARESGELEQLQHDGWMIDDDLLFKLEIKCTSSF